MTLECGTAEHLRVKQLAWIAIALYPVGLLLLNYLLLVCARTAILQKRPTALSSSIAFLHKEYEPHMYWWELVEMLRRFVLVGLMVLAQGSVWQILAGALLSVVFLLFQQQAAPYRKHSDDFFASCASFW